MEIGKRIKALREEKDLTQEELAERIQISRSALANYESGLREPKGDILKRFAKALDTTTDYLLGETDDPRPRPITNIQQEPKPSLKTKRLYDSIARAQDLPEENIDQITEALEALIKHYKEKHKDKEHREKKRD
ncbi:MAG: helix-turn-helix domain-containing protein [Bacillota bacterium]|jgi:transcriptional regulator with XRE-family HTH domain|nr:helix-turn-helix domain-containing protein [Bacillota bacterium]